MTRMGLVDAVADAAESLGESAVRALLRTGCETGSADPTGYDLVVNATPLGMNEGDPLPIDMNLVAADHVRRRGRDENGDHAVLEGAQQRGCDTQVGTDMLFEQIPAYLEFFGFGTATPDELRDVAQIQY